VNIIPATPGWCVVVFGNVDGKSTHKPILAWVISDDRRCPIPITPLGPPHDAKDGPYAVIDPQGRIYDPTDELGDQSWENLEEWRSSFNQDLSRKYPR
jgi:hypothetical protein